MEGGVFDVVFGETLFYFKVEGCSEEVSRQAKGEFSFFLVLRVFANAVLLAVFCLICIYVVGLCRLSVLLLFCCLLACISVAAIFWIADLGGNVIMSWSRYIALV